MFPSQRRQSNQVTSLNRAIRQILGSIFRRYSVEHLSADTYDQLFNDDGEVESENRRFEIIVGDGIPGEEFNLEIGKVLTKGNDRVMILCNPINNGIKYPQKVGLF
jgi:hypothetical protein